MTKIHPAAVENLRELDLDADDIALLAHVSGTDEEPPQGLHRGGWTEREDFYEWRYGDGLDLDVMQ